MGDCAAHDGNWLCHPGPGLDCYILVKRDGHPLHCPQCAIMVIEVEAPEPAPPREVMTEGSNAAE
jgi:hypothetical protein